MSAIAAGPLFKPLRLGALRLPNRIVMAPMTRSRASGEGVPNALAALYYGQRASAGLIISEATSVSAEGVGYPCTPGLYNGLHADAWRGIRPTRRRAGNRDRAECVSSRRT